MDSRLFTALSNNNFQEADLLLNSGADINDDKENILCYLWNKKCLSNKNLIYILKHNYRISYSDRKRNDDLIKTWIIHSKNSFLEIYLKYINIDKKKAVKDRYYKNAIESGNLDAIIILFDNDHRVKNKILYTIDYLLERSSFRVKRDFIMMVNDDNAIFHEENFYYNSNSFPDNHENFIDENKYNIIKRQLSEYFDDILFFKGKRKLVADKILNSNNDSFIQFIDENDIHLKELNTFNFDLLIYSILHKAPNDKIKLLINSYYSCDSFNYGIEVEFYVSTSKKITYTTHYITPLFAAITNNNFEIAEILLEKGAKINWEMKDGVPLFSHFSGALNQTNIMYIFKNGYKKYSNILMNWVENDEWQEDVLDLIIFQIMIHLNRFIPKMLNFYKNRIALSNEQIKKIVANEKVNIINEYSKDACYYAIERNKNEKLSILLQYFNNELEKNKILENLNKKESKDSYYSDDDDDDNPNKINRVPYHLRSYEIEYYEA